MVDGEWLSGKGVAVAMAIDRAKLAFAIAVTIGHHYQRSANTFYPHISLFVNYISHLTYLLPE